jgi:LysM repeat protein
MFRYLKLSLLLVVFTASIITYAQDTAALCQALVEQVLQSIAENCTDLATNEACYGHLLVDVVNQPQINTPGQHFPLHTPDRIQPRTVYLEGSAWGAVILNLQPRTAAADNSAFAILLGGAAIEPRILDDAVFLQFRTGMDSSPCDNTPPVLILYVPENRTFELTVNGALLEVSGLVTMQWTSENSFVATVHTGRMEIIGTGLAQEQQTVSAVMDAAIVLFWSAPREINAAEHRIGEFAQAVVTSLTGDVLEIQPVAITTETSNSNTDTNTGCDETLRHMVVAGENLYRIALRYGVTVDSLVAANNITDRTRLSIGQELAIPCGVDSGQSSLWTVGDPPGNCGTNTVHTVQRGENLYQIALRYGTTVDAITAANNITDPTLIHEGNQLRIPCSNGTPASGNTATGSPATASPPTTLNPTAADFCQQLLASAPPQGLSQDNVNLYNQYCT